jgi:hypothetical protein
MSDDFLSRLAEAVAAGTARYLRAGDIVSLSRTRFAPHIIKRLPAMFPKGQIIGGNNVTQQNYPNYSLAPETKTS